MYTRCLACWVLHHTSRISKTIWAQILKLCANHLCYLELKSCSWWTYPQFCKSNDLYFSKFADFLYFEWCWLSKGFELQKIDGVYCIQIHTIQLNKLDIYCSQKSIINWAGMFIFQNWFATKTLSYVQLMAFILAISHSKQVN